MEGGFLVRLLCVDDEKLVLDTLLHYIDWKNFGVEEVYGAYSVNEAKQYFKQKRIDVVICDIEMPGEGGMELMYWLGDHNPEVIRILLSCHTEFSYAAEAIRCGVFRYLEKPLNMEQLKEALEQAETEKKRKNMKLALLKSQIDAVEQHMEEGIEDSLVVKAAEYMKQDPAISREELAEKLYMSPVHLARIFKKETGMTLNEYATELRMEEAKSLLANTRKSISWIASQLCYQNFSYFSRVFKKETGMSPGEYREHYMA